MVMKGGIFLLSSLQCDVTGPNQISDITDPSERTSKKRGWYLRNAICGHALVSLHALVHLGLYTYVCTHTYMHISVKDAFCLLKTSDGGRQAGKRTKKGYSVGVKEETL